MSRLTAEERNALPDTAFGLPQERKYPMPDKSHAIDALARASEEYAKGFLTLAQKEQIDAKAREIIANS